MAAAAALAGASIRLRYPAVKYSSGPPSTTAPLVQDENSDGEGELFVFPHGHGALSVGVARKKSLNLQC